GGESFGVRRSSSTVGMTLLVWCFTEDHRRARGSMQCKKILSPGLHLNSALHHPCFQTWCDPHATIVLFGSHPTAWPHSSTTLFRLFASLFTTISFVSLIGRSLAYEGRVSEQRWGPCRPRFLSLWTDDEPTCKSIDVR